MIYILIIGLIVLSILIWTYTIKPLHSISRDLSVRIKEEIIPDIQKFLNLLTTLSSASIVLTFSFLQAFSNKVILYKEILVGSWVLFGASILMGVTAVNLIFIYRAQQKVMIKKFEDHVYPISEAEENIDAEKTEKILEAKSSLETMLTTQKRLFLVMYVSSASFFNAIVLLIVFAVSNV